MENKYTLSVLFVNYEDFWSKVVYYVLGKGYGHASIGVDQDEEVYYSFNFKGFRREKPRKHEAIVSKSICYKLSVTKEEFEIWMNTCKNNCRDTSRHTYRVSYNRIKESLGWRKLGGFWKLLRTIAILTSLALP